LPGLFERKEQYIWVHFLDPDGIKILSLGGGASSGRTKYSTNTLISYLQYKILKL